LAHKRTLIRKAIIEKLTGTTSAGERVFDSQVSTLWDDTFPTILVYARDESTEPLSVSDDELVRTMNVHVELCVEGDGLDDQLDNLCWEVETLLRDEDALGGHAHKWRLTNTAIDSSAEGEKPFAAAVLNYEISYVA
jgi:hypothetical protein